MPADAAATAAAAARLARADLASALVTEMTALAGVMGRHYARAEGQPEEVAQAVYESVLPRQARATPCCECELGVKAARGQRAVHTVPCTVELRCMHEVPLSCCSTGFVTSN